MHAGTVRDERLNGKPEPRMPTSTPILGFNKLSHFTDHLTRSQPFERRSGWHILVTELDRVRV
jgi:hypothetical protein